MKFAFKRALDLCLALVGLILFSPLIAATGLLVWFTMGTPVLFRQKRPGYRGKLFTIIKFRTMSQSHDRQGRLLPDGERLTRLGNFLRRSSLDELPELWNVLMGDLSFVGPRPLLVEYLDRYTPEQARRHLVKPGITGWAQVNGRNARSWEDKFALDVWYVDHWSLFLDIRIIFKTIGSVLRQEGISSEGHATMPKFGDTDHCEP
jgi:sugar transferase EpsL